METGVSLNQIGLYNPQRQSAEVTGKLFSVRQKQFELLLNKIIQENENSIPQHYLIIGQRGMGKTSILKRMEVELHKEQYRQRFIPLLFCEEQYNVKDLAEFWLNSLDALADSLEHEKSSKEILVTIDKKIKELSNKSSMTISDEIYKFLMDTCRDLHRRPVLLIDNIGLVFSRLDGIKKDKQEQYVLRKLLSENGAPIVVSAGVTVTDDVINYGMPFYDFFQIQYLKKLDYEEFCTLLKNLAIVTNSDEAVFTSLQKNASRQKSLLELTGGSPRTTVMLFKYLVKGFSNDINDDLEALADEITPLYKAKFEELPTQQQLILDAIAMNWDAISLRKLSSDTGMQNNQLSPQLKRLVDEGWIETTPAYKSKGNAYYISERFFNIWYLIRNSARRHKEKIYCLSKFLECFYEKEDLDRMSDDFLKQNICHPKDVLIGYALANTLKSGNRKKALQIEDKTYAAALQLSKDDDRVCEDLYIPERYKTVQAGKKRKKQSTRLPEDEIKVFLLIMAGFIHAQDKEYYKAIEYFDEALKLNPKHSLAWRMKGDTLIDLNNYEKAVGAFEQSISINPSNLTSKFNLLFLYRDILGKMDKAIELFNTINEIEANQTEDKNIACHFYLHKVLFELYKQNRGVATDYLLQAFDILEKENKLSSIASEHWWAKFGSVVVKIECGAWLLAILEEKGYDIVLSPYHAAIQALEVEKQDGQKGAEIYLKNRAAEISEPARLIIEKMRKYLD